VRSRSRTRSVHLAAPLDLVDQAAAETQEHVGARPKRFAFDPTEHHRLATLCADRCVRAHATNVRRSIRVHRKRLVGGLVTADQGTMAVRLWTGCCQLEGQTSTEAIGRKTQDIVWCSQEPAEFNL
jgi:hypothetical protein